MNYPTVRRVHSAFTLIELLVVVAIIALLSAILFPVFGQVRDKARASACMSNAKQIGLAMLQYTVDNDEKYPSGNESSLGAIDGSGWYSNIRPYLKEEGAVVCPSDPTVTANSTCACSVTYRPPAFAPRTRSAVMIGRRSLTNPARPCRITRYFSSSLQRTHSRLITPPTGCENRDASNKVR